MASCKTWVPSCGVLALGLIQSAAAQVTGQGTDQAVSYSMTHALGVDTRVEGLPASNSLGAEDIWQNPDFRGGVVNGGATARSNW